MKCIYVRIQKITLLILTGGRAHSMLFNGSTVPFSLIDIGDVTGLKGGHYIFCDVHSASMTRMTSALRKGALYT